MISDTAAFALVASLAPGPQATPASDGPTSWCETTAEGYSCTVGPIAVEEGRPTEVIAAVEAPDEPGYLTSFTPALVDVSGEPIDPHAVHLHHAVWLNPQRHDLACKAFDGFLPNPDRFFGAGKELTQVDLPEGFGYRWRPDPEAGARGSVWGFTALLDGMHGSQQAFVRLDLGFTPAAQAASLTAFRPLWLDVRNCDTNPVFTVAEGSGNGNVYRTSSRLRAPRGGRFVAMSGHLHDGGLRLDLDNLTRDRPIFTSRASYDMAGMPWFLTGMSSFTDPSGPRIRAGDVLRLTAVYDSTRTRHDAMGIMVGALVPD